MSEKTGMLNRLLQMAKPSGGSECCSVEIVEDVDGADEHESAESTSGDGHAQATEPAEAGEHTRRQTGEV